MKKAPKADMLWFTEKRFLKNLDPILFIGDDTALYFIGFNNEKEKALSFLEREANAFLPGETDVMRKAQRQIEEYMEGERKTFQLPLHIVGTEFHKKVWQALCTIPYGEVWSYKNLAEAVQSPRAYRAVGSANGANRFSIVIPCHRVIAHNQTIGGYGGGLDNKKGLLLLEQRFKG